MEEELEQVILDRVVMEATSVCLMIGCTPGVQGYGYVYGTEYALPHVSGRIAIFME